MMLKCVFLLALIITFVNASSIGSRTKRSPHNNDPNTVRLPTYSIYIIAFFMALMLFIIAFLLYVIWKQRSYDFKRLSTLDGNVNIREVRKHVRQDSNEMKSIRKINSFDNPYTNESTLTINSAVFDDNPSPMQSPTRTENDLRINPKRRNKKVPDEAIIRKEQIDQIIKNTLSNNDHDETTSLRNLNELLSKGKEDKSLRIHYEKTASTPELEVYDVLPSPRTPVKVSNDDEDVSYPPLYDCPPRQNNIIIPVMNGRYVMPISNEDPETEPSYINAFVRKHQK